MIINLEELAAVIRLLKEADFSEFSYAKGDVSLIVRRGELMEASACAVVAAASATPVAPQVKTTTPNASSSAEHSGLAPAENTEGVKIRAPLLGAFYSKPGPGEPPFVRVGDTVECDTVVCIVEVMKLMNSVSAGVSGVIAAVHARDGDLVEFDQPLFTVVEAA